MTKASKFWQVAFGTLLTVSSVSFAQGKSPISSPPGGEVGDPGKCRRVSCQKGLDKVCKGGNLDCKGLDWECNAASRTSTNATCAPKGDPKN